MLLKAIAFGSRKLAHNLVGGDIPEYDDGQERTLTTGDRSSLIALRLGSRLRAGEREKECWSVPVQEWVPVYWSARVMEWGVGKVGIGVLVVTKDGDDSEPDELQAIASNNRAVANMSAVRVVRNVRIPAGLL